MEGIVSFVDKDLNVNAQRFNIIIYWSTRIPFDMINYLGNHIIPMMYHRKLMQVVRGNISSNMVWVCTKG